MASNPPPAIDNDDAADGSTDDHQKPPSKPKPSFYIPNEILLVIAEQLRLPHISTDTSRVPKDFLPKRAALYNLCLTSKTLETYARPLLYEIVVFYLDSEPSLWGSPEDFGGLRELMILVRTLLNRPDYCRYIKHIVCPAGLRYSKWWSGNQVPSKEHL
ncbi:hypothetical protein F5Y04DRAFT_15178 [Hypomontagnella monticulosa]|nr:hypothetical protein F5Y04DRAFT_15178 [Hypomontagnella monticulosa]